MRRYPGRGARRGRGCGRSLGVRRFPQVGRGPEPLGVGRQRRQRIVGARRARPADPERPARHSTPPTGPGLRDQSPITAGQRDPHGRRFRLLRQPRRTAGTRGRGRRRGRDPGRSRLTSGFSTWSVRDGDRGSPPLPSRELAVTRTAVAARIVLRDRVVAAGKAAHLGAAHRRRPPSTTGAGVRVVSGILVAGGATGLCVAIEATAAGEAPVATGVSGPTGVRVAIVAIDPPVGSSAAAAMRAAPVTAIRPPRPAAGPRRLVATTERPRPRAAAEGMTMTAVVIGACPVDRGRSSRGVRMVGGACMSAPVSARRRCADESRWRPVADQWPRYGTGIRRRAGAPFTGARIRPRTRQPRRSTWLKKERSKLKVSASRALTCAYPLPGGPSVAHSHRGTPAPPRALSPHRRWGYQAPGTREAPGTFQGRHQARERTITTRRRSSNARPPGPPGSAAGVSARPPCAPATTGRRAGGGQHAQRPAATRAGHLATPALPATAAMAARRPPCRPASGMTGQARPPAARRPPWHPRLAVATRRTAWPPAPMATSGRPHPDKRTACRHNLPRRNRTEPKRRIRLAPKERSGMLDPHAPPVCVLVDEPNVVGVRHLGHGLRVNCTAAGQSTWVDVVRPGCGACGVGLPRGYEPRQAGRSVISGHPRGG